MIMERITLRLNNILPLQSVLYKAVGLFFIFFVIYLLFPNTYYTHDCIDYAYAVETGENLFHPHHILFNVLGHIIYVISRSNGLSILHFIASFSMAASLAIIFLLLSKKGWNTIWLYVFSVTNAVWFCGTSQEMYALTMFLCCLSWYSCLCRPLQYTWGLLTIICSVAAMTMHQTAVFSACALLITLFRQHRYFSYVFAVSITVLTGGIYAIIAYHQSISDIPSFVQWLTEYSHMESASGGAWGTVDSHTLPRLLWGILSTLWQVPDDIIEQYMSGTMSISYIQYGIIAIVGIAIGGIFYNCSIILRHLLPFLRQNIAVQGLCLWWIFLSAFTVWWEPNNMEFWVMAMVPFILMVSAVPIKQWSKPLMICCCILGVSNMYYRVIRSNSLENNAYYSVMNTIENYGIRHGDVILAFSTEYRPYFRYFYRKNIDVLSLGRQTYTHTTPQHAIDLYRGTLDSLRNKHKKIFVLSSEIQPDKVMLLYYPQWSAMDYKQCYEPFFHRFDSIGTFTQFGVQKTIYIIK